MISNGTVGQPYIVERDGVLLWHYAGKEFPVMAGGDGGGEGGAPAPASTPAPATDAPAPTSEAKPSDSGTKSQPTPAKDRGTSPWAKDLADRGLDDPRFDEYLRTSWQPRMTQHEQALAKYNQLFGDDETAEIASRVMQGLSTDAGATVKELVQLLGLDPQTLFEMQQAAQAAPEAQAAQQPQTPADPRMEWIEQQMQAQRQAQEDQQWQQHLEQVTERIPGFNPQLYTHLVIANQGDTEAAFRDYQGYHEQFGLAPKPADPEVPTLGEAPGAAPREASGPRTIQDAMKEYMAEERARAGR